MAKKKTKLTDDKAWNTSFQKAQERGSALENVFRTFVNDKSICNQNYSDLDKKKR